MKLYRRASRWWFRNQTGDLEYGPYTRPEAVRMRRQYRRFLRATQAVQKKAAA